MNATTLGMRRVAGAWWSAPSTGPRASALLAACRTLATAPASGPTGAAAPVITLQPTDQSTTVGGNASFNVAASARRRYRSIQWQALSGGSLGRRGVAATATYVVYRRRRRRRTVRSTASW